MTPSARTKQYLEKQGYHVAPVERWLTFPKFDPATQKTKTIRIRQDCYGCFDWLGIRHDKVGVLFVQVTDLTSVSKRCNKIAEQPATPSILKASNRIHVHGWGKKKGRYVLKVTEVTLDSDGFVETKVIDDMDTPLLDAIPERVPTMEALQEEDPF